MLGVFFGFDANAQSCPSYVPDGSVCVPFHVGEKSYYYPFSLGPYTSEADVISAIRQSFSMDSGCGTTGETVADILPGPYQWEDTYGGIKIRDYWRYSLTRIQQPPNCDQPVDIYFDYVWTRQLSCPDGFEKTTDSSNSEGTCFRTSARPDKGKNLGACVPPSVSPAPGAPDEPDACPFAGNPINVATQNKFQAEIDYVGAGSFPLTFVRYYNSQASTPEAAAPAGVRDSNYFGPGWSAMYFQSLRFITNAAVTYVSAYRPDGRVLRFAGSGSSYAAEVDVVEQLTIVTIAGGGTGWKLTKADGSTEVYNFAGQLLSVRARHGETHSLQYNSHNQLIAVIDSFGHALQFEYVGTSINAQISSLIDPAGQHTYYHTSANLVEVVYPDTTSRTYLYREGDAVPHLLVGIIDENNSRYSYYTYSSSQDGYATGTRLAGDVERFSITGYGPGSNWTDINDPSGVIRRVGIKTIRGVSRISQMSPFCAWCGLLGEFAHDANGNVSSRMDLNGTTTTYEHDLTRNLQTSRTEAAGTARARTIATQWHSSYRLPTLITEPKRQTSFTYNANGDVLTRTVADTSTTPIIVRTWAYTYDAWGRALTEDGPRSDVSDVTTYTYYSCTTGAHCGNLHTVTDAAGHVTTYSSYNAHGQPLTVIDDNGVVTTISYDLRKRVVSRSTDGETTAYEYWPTGLLKKVRLPDGSYLQYTYDAAHRLVETRDASGNRIAYTFDVNGNRTVEERYDFSDALSRTQIKVFNQLNQLWKTISSAESGSQVTQYSYDSGGNETSKRDPLGRITSKVYDELNRLKESIDPVAGVTKYTYDALDNVTSIIDSAGRATTYAYNGFSDLTEIVSPDAGTMTMTYDSSGNLQSRTDARGTVTTYSYDVLNRVVSVDFGDQLLTYTYDAGANSSGRLMSTGDSAQSQSWAYDSHGRVTSSMQTVGNVSLTIGYAYNNSLLSSLVTPSGQLVSYTYADGKVSAISINGTPVLNGIIREPFGAVRQWAWANGMFAARTVDHDGHVIQVDSGGEAYQYAYDNAGRLSSMSNISNSALSWTYTYDNRDRLSTAQRTGVAYGWTYDANGNRLSQSGMNTTDFTMSASSNRLTSTAGALVRTYTYDAAGNATAFSNRSLMFNNRGRLSSIQVGTVATGYIYNSLGYRVKKAGVADRYFAYDEQGHLIGEYDNAGALIQETVWFEDIPVATIRPNGADIDVFYVHADHLNTPRRISRPSDNAVVWRWDSDPFGTSAANEDPDGDTQLFVYNLRFPGQYYDAETGLHYNYRRDYDPSTGRYVQSDPIGLDGGLNTYLYAEANPLSNIDPTGEDAIAVPIPRPVPVPGWAGPAGAVAGAGLAGWQIGSAIYPHIAKPLGDLIDKVCEDDDTDDNCEVLYQSILATCASLSGRKKFRCFEAARIARDQCYAERGR